MALRALYLGTLAHLVDHEIIFIAKYKSNRDYEREIQRRAGDLKEVPTIFSRSVSFFDSVWYGMHEVTLRDVDLFAADQERIRHFVEG